jgi:hypothetical protein
MRTREKLLRRAFFLAAVLAMTDARGRAAELPGDISSQQLAEIGLAGLTPISDEEGSQVRGHGFRFVSGFSFSLNLSGLFPAFGTDQYAGSQPNGSSFTFSLPGTLFNLFSSGKLGNYGQGSSAAQGL